MIQYDQFPRAIEIQTNSYCNSGCTICPYREVSGSLPSGVMSQSLFESIINQIHAHPETKIVPYFNNEPFLDRTIVKRLKLINNICPNNEIEISTNGQCLTKKIQNQLQGVNIHDLRVSIFGFRPITHKQVMPGLDWPVVKNNLDCLVKDKKLRANIDHLSIIMVAYPGLSEEDIGLAKKYCKDNFVSFKLWGFFDRGGNVKEYSNKFSKTEVVGCYQDRPLMRLHVLFDGRVVLCCMDWKQHFVMGDLNVQTIQEVWDSAQYQDIRKKIYSPNEEAPKLCQKCILAK
ncbi:hypothetical protein COT78_03215 [Candidatus Berkelbacteria bacterium CG10_big_fil_rev_8_21_14_0_10_43_13]|uniref:4Fe4S-binding SPASM domain-containing protein n=1 Tax=Candidatus Berkelbacteria bacterium CG10_big_fil_rev_8_21_14_0_10_43_13 TaxID=1974514 RepID=A0A2H0W860_9BACT|nr:MAG: hypothetical protein COT78_03215 [Candidatus Berkelbacteria bacterium CG10_big_fil_rev_8_21_14_0_10_43_13]